MKSNPKHTTEARSFPQLLAAVLVPAVSRAPGRCSGSPDSHIDGDPRVVVICTSLQQQFECQPGLQINLFSIFKNTTKSFFLRGKLSVLLAELRLLHNSLLFSARSLLVDYFGCFTAPTFWAIVFCLASVIYSFNHSHAALCFI